MVEGLGTKDEMGHGKNRGGNPWRIGNEIRTVFTNERASRRLECNTSDDDVPGLR